MKYAKPSVIAVIIVTIMAFSMTVMAKPIQKQNDAGSGSDVTKDPNDPYSLTYGTYECFLTKEDQDAFVVKYNPGDLLKLEVIPNKGLDVGLAGWLGTRNMGNVNDGLKGELESFSLATDATSKHNRFTFVAVAYAGEGPYKIKLEKRAQDDCGTGKDAPKNWDEPLPIESSACKGSYLGSYDDYDDYSIKVEAGQTVFIKVMPSKTLDVTVGAGQYAKLHALDVGGGANVGTKGEPEELEIAIKGSGEGLSQFSVARVGETQGTYDMEIRIEQTTAD